MGEIYGNEASNKNWVLVDATLNLWLPPSSPSSSCYSPNHDKNLAFLAYDDQEEVFRGNEPNTKNSIFEDTTQNLWLPSSSSNSPNVVQEFISAVYYEGEILGNEPRNFNWILLDTENLSLPSPYSSATNRAKEFPSSACVEGGITGNESSETKSIKIDAQNLSLYSCSSSPNRVQECGSSTAHNEASTSAVPSSDLIDHFIQMGFSKSMVVHAIKENGESKLDVIVESLLTISALNRSPSKWELGPDLHSSESRKETSGDLFISESDFDYKEDEKHLREKEQKLLYLTDMGFPVEEASSAIDACGPDSSVMELVDFMYASQMTKTAEKPLQEPPHAIFDDDETGPSTSHVYTPTNKKRKNLFEVEDTWKRMEEKKSRQNHKRTFSDEDCMPFRIPMPMIGFGIPNDQMPMSERKLPGEAVGPPYFYYENVACTPKGVWSTISRFLHEIKPEFVDSVYFCAAARKRGYVHNLPIHNRYPLMPIPPLTIQEAFPSTKRWWPSWDKRTKLNCLRTRVAPISQKVKDMLERCDGVPSLKTQYDVLRECKEGNLVWIGKNRLAPLEPDEMEMILGYPENHTRGGGITRMERYNALGNSFQVDTVAYHLSVLKSIFLDGITVLSLFSGIGGAEVALHRLGIPLKNVVSVEKSEVNRNILRSWWEQTDQTGNLIEIEDVEQLTADKLGHFTNLLGGFDLIVGGSPCNNLTGSNHATRVGLEGKHSILFYDYFRILDMVKCIMRKKCSS